MSIFAWVKGQSLSSLRTTFWSIPDRDWSELLFSSRFHNDILRSHCARPGGDEFVLLPPAVSPQTASALAEKVRFEFNQHDYEAGNSRVSLSVGVASLDAVRDMALETLVSCADEALYRAKLLGRNRVEVQSVWMPETAAGNSDAPMPSGDLQHSTSESANRRGPPFRAPAASFTLPLCWRNATLPFFVSPWH